MFPSPNHTLCITCGSLLFPQPAAQGVPCMQSPAGLKNPGKKLRCMQSMGRGLAGLRLLLLGMVATTGGSRPGTCSCQCSRHCFQHVKYSWMLLLLPLAGVLQVPDEEKRRLADYVVDTGCSMEQTQQQVTELICQLKNRQSTAAAARALGRGFEQ